MGIVVDHIPYDPSTPDADVKLLYSYPLPSQPGWSIVGIRVAFPPGGATPPHRHGTASVAATVLSGAVFNRMNDGPTLRLAVGESFFEHPGCHHRTSANADDSAGGDDAVILATMVAETAVVEEQGLAGLVIIDEEWR